MPVTVLPPETTEAVTVVLPWPFSVASPAVEMNWATAVFDELKVEEAVTSVPLSIAENWTDPWVKLTDGFVGVMVRVWPPPLPTVTVLVPLMPCAVAVMVAVPVLTPVTTPVAETVATLVADLVQLTLLRLAFVPSLLTPVAVSWVVAPTLTVVVAGLTVMEVSVCGTKKPHDAHPAPNSNASSSRNVPFRIRMADRMRRRELWDGFAARGSRFNMGRRF